MATAAAGLAGPQLFAGHTLGATAVAAAARPIGVPPITLRKATLAAVDKDLTAAGILDTRTGKPTEKLVAELSWEREEVLPTPGVLVKGCLDKCETCEPALQKEIELNLERKRLENEMLKRQVELLEKAQEYRCCPGGGEKAEEPPDE